MFFEIIMLIGWLVVALVFNDSLNFRDWSTGIVTGVLFASICIRFNIKRGNFRRWLNG